LEPEPREELEDDDLKFNNKLKKSYSRAEKFLDNPNEASKLKKIIFWLCGIESMLKPKNSDEINSTDTESNVNNKIIDTCIYQDPFWSKFCDVNAVIAMALCGFCYGFFNKFN
jgi:hypothetical protein